MTKQKRQLNYKIKKIKDINGKTTFVKVREKETGVQPANTYLQKGKLKNQPRYNPKIDDVSNSTDNPGSWPHNRNPTPDEGWYGSPSDANTFNSDMRMRVQPWEQYISDRDKFLLTLTKP